MSVTLNPADVAGSTPTFSNGNRSIASSVDSSGSWARSTSGSTKPFYAECVYDNTNNEYGICSATQAINTLGDSEPNKGVAIYTNATHWFWYSDNIPQYGQFSTGTGSVGARLCVAVDPVNGRAWARLNNGNWNNSGTANPATNTEGINISDFGSKLYMVAKSSFTYLTATIYFASADWTYSPPSGFGPIPRRRIITVG